ncbi:probable inactive peptidyl-prolyl cis-trans isomerase-like 6 isoform X2 [Onthophagus taurus]|uniref:probable inactive peptidyl-prolyl cis-trans isomerase-like 6 isoform X2 n=1 Tax=Onthophagus taurus TaxID=166361 RepID=UPI000C20E5F8|nr:peptidyl-prolyl cis-trans isomerase-like 6 isoform X2 [Onthophagus taurus]
MERIFMDGGKVWTLEKGAVVFLDNQFIGDDVALFNFAIKKARMRVTKDFHCLGVLELTDIYNKAVDIKRKFAYLQVSIDNRCVGSLLFLLYFDQVPRTVRRFLRRCKSKKRGFLGRPIHRIVKGSWLQMGGFDLENRPVPCENYLIPHDRRGVLSTCHQEKHTNNTTQFVISLDPTPWMDCKYVAFGQLIQGEEVLKRIESVPTDYESPKKSIIITKCGLFTLESEPDKDEEAELDAWLAQINKETGIPDDVLDPNDVPSDLSVTKYKQGLYCYQFDLEPHPALNKWYLYYEAAKEPIIPPTIVGEIEGESVYEETDSDIWSFIRDLITNDILKFIREGNPSMAQVRDKMDLSKVSPEVLKMVENIIETLLATIPDDGNDQNEENIEAVGE